MARKGAKVLLGFEDELITDKYKSCTDFTTNKIGGKPDWYGESKMPSPVCQLCGLSLPMILQIYAPLENSAYHRTLYMFACINPNCWNQKESWLCLRSQQLDAKTTETNVGLHSEQTVNTSMWCDDANNWEDEENGNTIEGLLNQPQSSDEDLSSSMAQLSCDEQNANSEAGGIVGATGRLLSPTATAEIEGDESEVVTIDTPETSQFDLVALLEQVSPVPQVPSFEFVSYFISVSEEERRISNSPTNADHVQDLLHEYKQWTVDEEYNNVAVLNNQTDPDSTNNMEVCEKYEKSVPAHGDKMFHHFVSRIQSNPGQILRYIRDAGSPLFLYPVSDLPISCRHCQGELVYEMQILPTLIQRLQLVGGGVGHLEFGTVFILACRRSCWTTGDNMKQEYIIVQREKI